MHKLYMWKKRIGTGCEYPAFSVHVRHMFMSAPSGCSSFLSVQRLAAQISWSLSWIIKVFLSSGTETTAVGLLLCRVLKKKKKLLLYHHLSVRRTPYNPHLWISVCCVLSFWYIGRKLPAEVSRQNRNISAGGVGSGLHSLALSLNTQPSTPARNRKCGCPGQFLSASWPKRVCMLSKLCFNK